LVTLELVVSLTPPACRSRACLPRGCAADGRGRGFLAIAGDSGMVTSGESLKWFCVFIDSVAMFSINRWRCYRIRDPIKSARSAFDENQCMAGVAQAAWPVERVSADPGMVGRRRAGTNADHHYECPVSSGSIFSGSIFSGKVAWSWDAALQ